MKKLHYHSHSRIDTSRIYIIYVYQELKKTKVNWIKPLKYSYVWLSENVLVNGFSQTEFQADISIKDAWIDSLNHGYIIEWIYHSQGLM